MSNFPTLKGCEVLPPISENPPDDNPGGRNKAQPADTKIAGRFHLINGFVDSALRKLSRGEIAVWLVLFRDSRDGIAATSQAAIARQAGCNERSVRRALRKLEREHLVEIVRQGGLTRGRSSYRVKSIQYLKERRTLVSAD